MWFLHETHAVRGEAEGEFDALLRDAWIPRLAGTADARVAFVRAVLTYLRIRSAPSSSAPWPRRPGPRIYT